MSIGLQFYTRYSDAAISNATVNAKIRYGNSAHMGDGCRQKLCIQNCGQTVVDRDMASIESLHELVIVLSNSTSVAIGVDVI